MAELTPFLPPFFPPPEISSFWRTSIAITPSGNQKVLSILVRRKHLIGSSLLTSSPSMILTYLLFSIAPLAVMAVISSLTSLLLPPVSPILAPERCFGNWVLITYQFFNLSLSLWPFAPMSVPLLLIFKKLAGMTLLLTLAFTVLLQRNTRLFLVSLLVPSSLFWH